MILSTKGAATRQFIEHGKSKFSGLDVALARRRIATLNAASSLVELGKLQSVGLHKLKGGLRDYWSIDINGRWRLLFRFRHGNAVDVHIFDPH
jgi:proteic killer suppression protein